MTAAAKPFAASTVLTATTNLALAALGMTSGILAARLLGPHGRGELAAIQTWPAFVATLSMLGMPEAIVYYAASDPQAAGRYLGSAVVVALASSVPTVTAAYLLMPLLLQAQAPAIVSAGRWYLFLVPLYALVGMLLHPVRGRSDFAPWNMMRLMPNTLWIGVLLLAWLVSRTTPTYIAAANLVALGSLIIPFGALVVRRVPGPFTPDREKLPEMLRYGLPCMVTSVPQMLNLRLDQLVMVAVIPPRDLGLYVVAVAWSSAVSPILNSVGAVAMPAVASSADHRFAAQRLCRAVRMATALAALMSLVVTAAAPVAIELFFGAAFRGSLSSALVLIPAAGVLGINYTLQEGIRGLGFPYEVLRAELIGLAMTGIGLAVMLPTFGILGAAIASLVGYSSVGASLAATACRRTGAGPTELLVPKLAEIRDAIAHVGALARSALAPA